MSVGMAPTRSSGMFSAESECTDLSLSCFCAVIDISDADGVHPEEGSSQIEKLMGHYSWDHYHLWMLGGEKKKKRSKLGRLCCSWASIKQVEALISVAVTEERRKTFLEANIS